MTIALDRTGASLASGVQRSFSSDTHVLSVTALRLREGGRKPGNTTVARSGTPWEERAGRRLREAEYSLFHQIVLLFVRKDEGLHDCVESPRWSGGRSWALLSSELRTRESPATLARPQPFGGLRVGPVEEKLRRLRYPRWTPCLPLIHPRDATAARKGKRKCTGSELPPSCF